MEAIDIARAAREALAERKAEDIALIDVREGSMVTDYYLIVSGTSSPHLKAMHRYVQHALKEKGQKVYRKSGDPESGWMVLDYLNVIIHIFVREAREYYAIEDLWDQAPRIP